MTRFEFDSIITISTHVKNFKKDHVDLLFDLVKSFDKKAFRKTISYINKIETFPKRHDLLKMLSSHDSYNEVVLNNTKYRAKINAKYPSFSIDN